jgi:hypothetical protein
MGAKKFEGKTPMKRSYQAVFALLLGLSACSKASNDAPSEAASAAANRIEPIKSAQPNQVASVAAPIVSAKALTSALPVDPSFASMSANDLGNKCYALYKKKDLDAAQAACVAAVNKLDKTPWVDGALFFNLALVAEKRGNCAAARAYYTHSLEVRPTGAGVSAVQGALKKLPAECAGSADEAQQIIAAAPLPTAEAKPTPATQEAAAGAVEQEGRCHNWENNGPGLVQGTMCCSHNPFNAPWGIDRGPCSCRAAPSYCK